jgi:hypothetical protein
MTNLTQISNAAPLHPSRRLRRLENGGGQAELAKREKALKAALATRMDRSNSNALDGDFFRVTRSEVERSTLDAAAVKAMLANPPMKTSVSTTYRVNARVAEAA